jgi:hypothetical protein
MPFWLYSPPLLALEFSLKGFEMLEQHCCLALQLQREMLRAPCTSDQGVDLSGTSGVPFPTPRRGNPAVIELR